MPDEVKLLPCPNAIYVRFVEGRYGTHIQKWAHEPFDGGTEYTRAIEAQGLLQGEHELDMLRRREAARAAIKAIDESRAALHQEVITTGSGRNPATQ